MLSSYISAPVQVLRFNYSLIKGELNIISWQLSPDIPFFYFTKGGIFISKNETLIFKPVNSIPDELQNPRLREEVVRQIESYSQSYAQFKTFDSDTQEAFIQFCMGNRGLQITYEPFFQKIFDPEHHPERLNRLLSSILKQSIKVVRILPREGIRLAEKSSLVIMDILVESQNGSLINVEIQKYGYHFPMERSFCYGADMLVRQYSKLKDEKHENFTYKDMRPVYVIVLMEKSPAHFHKHTPSYIHKSSFTFDTGLQLNNLLNFIYISLDIFRSIPHNEIEELEAWLYFLSSAEPYYIQQIIRKYPFFKDLYQEIIKFQYQPKELINMYSETLALMDHNTIKLMVDELKEENSMLSDEIIALKEKIARLEAELTGK